MLSGSLRFLERTIIDPGRDARLNPFVNVALLVMSIAVADKAAVGWKFETAGPVSRHFDVAGYKATTGIGTDLMQAAREAVAAMVEWISSYSGMSTVDAYMLCSVCGDLRISEIVNRPNQTVSFYFPKPVLG